MYGDIMKVNILIIVLFLFIAIACGTEPLYLSEVEASHSVESSRTSAAEASSMQSIPSKREPLLRQTKMNFTEDLDYFDYYPSIEELASFLQNHILFNNEEIDGSLESWLWDASENTKGVAETRLLAYPVAAEDADD